MAVNFYKQILDGEVIGVFQLEVDEFLDLRNKSAPNSDWEMINAEEAEELRTRLIKEINEEERLDQYPLDIDLKTFLLNWSQVWNVKPTVEELEAYFQWYKK